MFGNLEKNKNRIKQIEFEKHKNVFQIHMKNKCMYNKEQN